MTNSLILNFELLLTIWIREYFTRIVTQVNKRFFKTIVVCGSLLAS